MKFFAPGFTSPTDAQSCFRGILQALSTPGVIVTLDRPVGPPPGLSAAAASVLLTLVDSTVSASLPEGDDAARDWLVFHAGVRLTTPGDADFVMARDHFDLSSAEAKAPMTRRRMARPWSSMSHRWKAAGPIA